MSKQVQKVCNAISTAAVVLVVILALLLVGVRLVGLRPMCVLSGSMEPTYHTGSLIYVKPCAPEDVQVGDAITFVLNEDLDVVTHRVISIDAENEHFYTQGDANDAPDGAPVYFKNLIGRPVFTPVSGLCFALGLEPAGDVSGHCDRDRAAGSGVPAGHAAQGG